MLRIVFRVIVLTEFKIISPRYAVMYVIVHQAKAAYNDGKLNYKKVNIKFYQLNNV